jgi:hypothetical protein
VLLTLVVGVLGMRLFKLLPHRGKALMLQRLADKPAATSEQERRVETLMNILSSFVRIVLWVMIAMLVLRNLVNPLITS